MGARRVDRRRAARGPVGRGATRRASCCTATTSPTTSWPGPSRRGWGGSWSTPSTRSTGWPASPRGPASSRPKVLVRVTPGVEAHTHEFVRTGQEDSKFGFGLALGRGRRGGRAAPGAARRRARRGPRPHRQPGVPGGVLRRRGRGAGRVLRPARAARAVRGWRARRRRTSPGRAHRRIAEWAQSVHDACREAGIPADAGSRPSRAGRSWPPPG